MLANNEVVCVFIDRTASLLTTRVRTMTTMEEEEEEEDVVSVDSECGLLRPDAAVRCASLWLFLGALRCVVCGFLSGERGFFSDHV